MKDRTEAVERAEVYYDSSEADAFYQTFWGGEDIHIGLYASDEEPIDAASRRTVRTMAARLARGRRGDAHPRSRRRPTAARRATSPGRSAAG